LVLRPSTNQPKSGYGPISRIHHAARMPRRRMLSYCGVWFFVHIN